MLEGRPYMKGILSFILGMHVMEQATGAAATTGMRLFGRGEAVGTWRGVIIKKSPLAKFNAKILNWRTGGRVTAAAGYYFHDAGRTWQGESFTLDIKGTPRTLTHIYSLSIPHREHFFDRPLTLGNGSAAAIGDDAKQREVTVQNVVNIVKGDEDPATIPGYIGSVNEFENATRVLGAGKRILFAANWFLVDESERDTPTPDDDVNDYYSLLGLGEQKKAEKEKEAQKKISLDKVDRVWPNTSGPNSTPEVIASSEKSYASNLFGKTGRSLKEVTQTINIGGKSRALLIDGIEAGMFGQSDQAIASWYDEDERKWKMVVDDDIKKELAREVADPRSHFHITTDEEML
ncbi:MAG: hypothetical protein GY867_09245 [bacterium]|nr:hypothetical protein [bacterium]